MKLPDWLNCNPNTDKKIEHLAVTGSTIRRSSAMMASRLFFVIREKYLGEFSCALDGIRWGS
jgi:hypothetical protein